MDKKIFIEQFLCHGDEVDVARVQMDNKVYQLCFSKDCNIKDYVGRYVMYDCRNGATVVSDVDRPRYEFLKSDEDRGSDDVDVFVDSGDPE